MRTRHPRAPITLAWGLGLLLGLPVAAVAWRALAGGSLAASLGTGAVRDALVLSLVTTGASVVIVSRYLYAESNRRFS